VEGSVDCACRLGRPVADGEADEQEGAPASMRRRLDANPDSLAAV
jgi:hypothetical protein